MLFRVEEVDTTINLQILSASQKTDEELGVLKNNYSYGLQLKVMKT